MKTLCRKEEILVTNIFSFSTMFSTLLKTNWVGGVKFDSLQQALAFMCVQYKSFKNTGGKEEVAHFPLFPQCFQPNWRFCYLKLLSANFFNLDHSRILSFGKELNCHLQVLSINPFPNKPWFLHVCNTSVLKTLWENEKFLVMSNFSFSHSVFYLYGELCHFHQTWVLVCKLCQFGRV